MDRHGMRVAGATVVVLLALAGCVAIPTQGPIGEGDVVVDEPGPAIQVASDPIPDAGPAEIVSGFLTAGGIGLYDEFTVARKFLTPEAAQSWQPRAGVIVYPVQGGPSIDARPNGSVLVSVPLAATVDATGVYTEAEPVDSRSQVVFDLQLDADGQWRISRLDDGVLMAASAFTSQYRRTPLYFATPDLTSLVPDLRWFPTEKIASSAVTALLQGPSPWLQDAVVTGVPEGARLSTAAVSISPAQVATVDLAAPGDIGGDRNLLQAQLEAMLMHLPGTVISKVEVTVGQLPWRATEPGELARDVMASSGPYALRDGLLWVLDGGTLRRVPDAAPLAGLIASDPAVSLDEQIRVVLDSGRRLFLVPLGAGQLVELTSGTALLAPSIDPLGWIWTGEQQSAGVLRAVTAQGVPVDVAAEWLTGRTVRSVRISRDGARAAVVSAGASPEDVTVDVVAVVRGEDGTPQLLGDPLLAIGAALTDAREVAWVDEVTLAVLGQSATLEPTMHMVPLGGPTTALPLKDGAVGIAAGRGDRARYLVDTEGQLFSWQSGSWVREATGVQDPVFPG